MNHTPGPWHLFERNSLCIESASGNVALCNLARDNEADARLIAAAPDLLEALRRIYEEIPAKPNMSEAGRVAMMAEIALAAIDKATGR